METRQRQLTLFPNQPVVRQRMRVGKGRRWVRNCSLKKVAEVLDDLRKTLSEAA